MLTSRIPYSFLQLVVPRLTWQDIAFGLARNYVSSEVAIQFACDRVAAQENPSPDELALASSLKDEPVLRVVESLAARESTEAPVDANKRWLCLLLTWLYENRESEPDALELIDEIYVDFDYPEEIGHLVSYMPNTEPDLGSKEANRRRLIERWGDFVEKCKQCMST